MGGGVRAQDEARFLAGLTPNDKAAAGLDKLTPGERAHLQALVEAYKIAPTASASTVRPEPTAPAPTPTVVVNPGSRVQYATITSTIAGDFNGWKPGQVLALANGQRWRVTDYDGYYIRLTTNPEVEVTPSKFGGYWMKFPTLKVRVRVELIK